MTDGLSAADWSTRYGELQQLYQTFVDRVLTLLEDLLEEEGYDPWHTYTWALSESRFESLLNRARRAGRELADPLQELGEFAGVSIVMASPTALEPVADIVVRELDVDYAASRPLQEIREALERRLGAENVEVDYPHAYYTVSVAERRRRLAEWKSFSDLRAEVHVLTISQYTSWCLQNMQLPHYWPESHTPPTREAFARVASLLAEVDRVLESEEESRPSVDDRYENAILEGDLEIELDTRAVAAYLRTSSTLQELAAVAEAEGMDPDDDEYVEPSAYELEQETLWLLRRHGIETLAELDAFVRAALPRARSILGHIARVSTERGFVPIATREGVLAFLLLVLHRAPADEVELAEFAEEISYALNTLIGNPIADSG